MPALSRSSIVSLKKNPSDARTAPLAFSPALSIASSTAQDLFVSPWPRASVPPSLAITTEFEKVVLQQVKANFNSSNSFSLGFLFETKESLSSSQTKSSESWMMMPFKTCLNLFPAS